MPGIDDELRAGMFRDDTIDASDRSRNADATGNLLIDSEAQLANGH